MNLQVLNMDYQQRLNHWKYSIMEHQEKIQPFPSTLKIFPQVRRNLSLRIKQVWGFTKFYIHLKIQVISIIEYISYHKETLNCLTK